MDGTPPNDKSCANQIFAFDPHIVTDSRRIKPFLIGSTSGFYPF
jgi:hypothetical protein